MDNLYQTDLQLDTNISEKFLQKILFCARIFQDVGPPGSLRGWLEFSEAVHGVRLRTGGLDFAASPYVFPGRDGKPFTNEAFNPTEAFRQRFGSEGR